MAYPLDFGTTYNKSISNTDLLNNPAHATIHNNLATEIELVKKRALGVYYVGAYKTSTNTAGEALIAAITAANAAGGGLVVLMPNTTHTVQQKLSIGSNIGIQGHGYGSVVKLGDNQNTNIFENSDTSSGNTGLVFNNFRIDGNKANQTSNVHGINWQKVTRSLANNLWIHDCKYHGMIEWYGSTYNIVDNLITWSNGGHGFIVDGPAISNGTKYHTISNIFGFSNTLEGVFLAYSTNMIVSNIHAVNNSRNGFTIYYLQDGVTISGVDATGNTQNGLAVTNSSGVSINKIYCDNNGSASQNNIDISGGVKLHLTDFHSYNSLGQGVYIHDSSDCKLDLGHVETSAYNGITLEDVEDCKIANVTCESNGQHGFWGINTDYSNITGCTAKNNSTGAAGAQHGFYFSGTSVRNNITGCIAYDDQVSKTQGYGYSYGGSADYNNLSGNQFAGNLTGAANTNTNDKVDGSNVTS